MKYSRTLLIIDGEVNAKEYLWSEPEKWSDCVHEFFIDEIRHIYNRVDRPGITIYLEHVRPKHIKMSKDEFLKKVGIKVLDLRIIEAHGNI